MRRNRQYIIKSYMRSSLWLMPFFTVLVYMVVTRVTHGTPTTVEPTKSEVDPVHSTGVGGTY